MRRSKISSVLPPKVREALDQKLIAGAFSDYNGLSAWLAKQGFTVSRSSLQRYGSAFEQRLQAVALAAQQARAVVAASPDSEGAMSDALTRLVQEKIFGVLVEAEDVSENQLARLARAVADLGRATIAQRRWAQQVRERLEMQNVLPMCASVQWKLLAAYHRNRPPLFGKSCSESIRYQTNASSVPPLFYKLI